MKRVVVEELLAHPLRFLVGEEPLAIEMNGKLLGTYHPVNMSCGDESKPSFTTGEPTRK